MSEPQDPSRPLEVVYNSACPVCRAGVESYREMTALDARPRAWIDINERPETLAAHGVTTRDVQLKLHAVDREGRLLVGMPAVAAIWAETPGRRWLARLAQAPVLRWAANAGYHLTAHILFRWNRLAGNF